MSRTLWTRAETVTIAWAWTKAVCRALLQRQRLPKALSRESRELWVWGRGGYYRLVEDESGIPCIPAGWRAWRAFIAHAPPEWAGIVYAELEAWCRPLVPQADKVGPKAAARFGKEARAWLVAQKQKQREESDGG